MDMDGGRVMKELKQSGPYTVGIGYQDFGKIRRDHIFYVDKTGFIRAGGLLGEFQFKQLSRKADP